MGQHRCVAHAPNRLAQGAVHLGSPQDWRSYWRQEDRCRILCYSLTVACLGSAMTRQWPSRTVFQSQITNEILQNCLWCSTPYKMVKPLIIFWQCTAYITDHELSELKRHSGQSACRPRQRVAAVYGVTSGAVSWSDLLAIILSITFCESVEQD